MRKDNGPFGNIVTVPDVFRCAVMHHTYTIQLSAVIHAIQKIRILPIGTAGLNLNDSFHAAIKYVSDLTSAPVIVPPRPILASISFWTFDWTSGKRTICAMKLSIADPV
jgi:hypothetical protein